MADANEPEPAAEEEEPQRKRKRGSSGLPRGVQPVQGGQKYLARASYKPPGATKNEQRHIGTFATVEEAEAAVAEAEAKLRAGVSAWDEPARKNEHKRGEVCVQCENSPARTHTHLRELILVCDLRVHPLLAAGAAARA